jgi:hypothetical protein
MKNKGKKEKGPSSSSLTNFIKKTPQNKNKNGGK